MQILPNIATGTSLNCCSRECQMMKVTSFYCDRCPVKPISLERATWDPQPRSHPLTTLREDSTLERCSPPDSCSTTVKGYTLIHTCGSKSQNGKICFLGCLKRLVLKRIRHCEFPRYCLVFSKKESTNYEPFSLGFSLMSSVSLWKTAQWF